MLYVASVQRSGTILYNEFVCMKLYENLQAVSCLKRAHYLEPFEWIIAYNLGIIFLNTGQFAGAFHYLSAAINLKPDFANSYMYLAIALARLGDFENAASGYQKALNIDE